MNIPPMNCPFCNLSDVRCVLTTRSFNAVRDSFPVSRGHTLLVPKRHVASVFDLDDEESREIWSAVAQVRRQLQQEFNPDGFNIGVNDGIAAGQTVPHAHIHIIPRFTDDVPDPRGGVRWVIPTKADYWSHQES